MGPYLIWSMEHDAWWKPNGVGYTRVLADAGRYHEHEAAAIVARANIIRCHEAMIPEVCVRPAFHCPRCGAISYHPTDIDQRYCGACHQFETP